MKRRKKNLSCPLTFLALQIQSVVLVSAFVTVSIVWSVSCLLFFYSLCPPCPAICKSGGRVPPAPMESAPLFMGCIVQHMFILVNSVKLLAGADQCGIFRGEPREFPPCWLYPTSLVCRERHFLGAFTARLMYH